MNSTLEICAGKPLPHGASITGNGVNFSIFSRNAVGMSIALFEKETDSEPYFTYRFDPEKDRTGDIWHIHINGIGAGTLYLYKAEGPFRPEQGHRFNSSAWLLEPYAKALTSQSLFMNLPPVVSAGTGISDAAKLPKCVIIDDTFDWQGDRPLNYPLKNSVLYELHLKGATANPNSSVQHPGTFRGLTEKIPYFKDLGITSIELLPIQEFDEYENANVNPKNGQRLKNFWGYSTMSFFAPKARYAADLTPGGCVREFKEMVREMHKAGLEIILDIVFNHTAEGNEHGITMNFRGLDNSIFYILEEHNKAYYTNYSGCGNTLNCNHPVVRDFIIDCLRYWVCEMHVDGFRFDLGSILGRDSSGHLMEDPPVLERIAEDPVLRNTKIIAEAWDAGGAYQVGSFPGGRWAEWNDRFRDDMRRFWRGDDGLSNAFATRMAGSSDLYLRDGRKPFHSVNFLTSHDGFTLNDLVSYNGKHNEENGEDNRDGNDNNSSWNYGEEGPSSDARLENLRTRQVKNLLFSLLLSQGTPMLLAGDEFRRTQGGNNNAYCQDNASTWLDWSCRNTYSDLFRFTKRLIMFRRKHQAFMRPEFFQGRDISLNSLPDITWFDESGMTPDWSRINHFLAFRLDGSQAEICADTADNDFYIMCNASTKDKTVKLPKAPEGKSWYRCIDTSIEAPEDFMTPGEEEMLPVQTRYVLPSRSCALLLSK